MQKKKLFIFLAIIVSCFHMNKVYAFSSSDYRYRSLCGNFEVARFNKNGSIDRLSCHNDYGSAKSAMQKNGESGTAILTNVNNESKIIDANVALLDLTIPPDMTNFYTNSELSGSSYTYMDTGSLYGGVDGAHLDTAYSNSNNVWTAKVKIGNFTGWIHQNYYEIVPITWVKSASSYTITNDSIRHNYVAKIQNEYYGNAGSTIGPKPSMLDAGTYYSYDGHYFYKDLTTMIKDYKNNNYNNSVNKNNPYYNYYMYLSNHTKTKYSSTNIDEYIRNNMGIKKDVYGNDDDGNSSRLYGKGTFFYYAQEKYGVNAILALSLSRNETGNGRSSLSINKNNGFGLNAVDSNPTQAANWYASFASSILGYASKWITYGYAHPRDWRYFGPQFGDKWIGMNVKYASDTFWSEKMAANYYSLDKALGLQDYDSYQLGVVTGPTNAYKEANSSSKLIYNYPEAEDGLVIVDEVKGQSINGNNTWYKIISDLNIDSNYNEITSGDYNWNSFVYVPAAYVKKINKAKDGYLNPNELTEYKNKNYTYDLLIENTELKPKVAVSTKDTSYYYDSTLDSNTGISLKKDRYVMVYAIAYENNNPMAYLVTSDYKFDQKHWVSADSLKLITADYGYFMVNVNGNQYTWVTSTTIDQEQYLISGLYSYSYAPILEEKYVGNDLWYKVPVNLSGNNNIYGWTLGNYKTVSVQKFTSKSNNNKPVINAKDKTITKGKTFNALDGVTASDAEDGDLTKKLKVKENNYKDEVGVYKVIYEVTDSSNLTTTKEIKVTVIEDSSPVINAYDKTILLNEEFNELDGVTASDTEDGDLTKKLKVIKNTVNTKEKGTYQVIYQVTDSANHKVEKSIKVEVIDIDIDTDNLQEKDAIFYFDSLKIQNEELVIKGYNAIKGIDNNLNTNINYFLVYESIDNEEDIHVQSLSRITDKNEMSRPVYQTDGKDYTYSWFKGELDIDNLPDGDYRIYIMSLNDKYYSLSIVSNKVLKEQISTFTKTKTVTTRNNYLDDDVSLELIIRSEKIGNKNSTSTYNEYNQYRTLEFTNNKLHIKGTSYSYGMDLSSNATVNRKIIFENTENYKQYRYNLGSITDGLYKVGATLNDNKDKTRAWFDASIDISNIPKGIYAIYISNDANISDFGELNELLQRNVNSIVGTIDNKKYSFRVNEEKRYRIELEVK